MARKPVLTGGKRDEIINTSMKLFFENGYEATSVRMIMNAVDGEIGMFYHYFRSKEELFDKVVDSFFKGYEERFGTLVSQCASPEEFINAFLPMYFNSMTEFEKIKENMHWTIQYAMSARTIMALREVVTKTLSQWEINSGTPLNILAGQLLYALSATIHSEEFIRMDDEEKKNCIMNLVDKLIH
jgi:AcrR family transcriptional regulator